MVELKARHDAELNRMYDTLKGLEPGSEEYDKVLSDIMKAKTGENEIKKIEADEKSAKKELTLRLIMFGAGLVLTPVIDVLCKRNLAKFIGEVEQMETFTSMPGKSISSWFRWK